MESDIEFWNKAAKFYTGFKRKRSQGYKALSNILAEHLTPDMKVLELGCGTGQITFFLENKVSEYIATDFSKVMIDICRRRCIDETDIDFRVEDGTKLSFPDNSFDAVIAVNLLHVVPDSDAIIKEIKRVVKPNGIVFAPIYVYNEKKFILKVWLLERMGLKIYKKFTKDEYLDYIKSQSLEVVSDEIVEGRPLNEYAVIARV